MFSGRRILVLLSKFVSFPCPDFFRFLLLGGGSSLIHLQQLYIILLFYSNSDGFFSGDCLKISLWCIFFSYLGGKHKEVWVDFSFGYIAFCYNFSRLCSLRVGVWQLLLSIARKLLFREMC